MLASADPRLWSRGVCTVTCRSLTARGLGRGLTRRHVSMRASLACADPSHLSTGKLACADCRLSRACAADRRGSASRPLRLFTDCRLRAARAVPLRRCHYDEKHEAQASMSGLACDETPRRRRAGLDRPMPILPVLNRHGRGRGRIHARWRGPVYRRCVERGKRRRAAAQRAVGARPASVEREADLWSQVKVTTMRRALV